MLFRNMDYVYCHIASRHIDKIQNTYDIYKISDNIAKSISYT